MRTASQQVNDPDSISTPSAVQQPAMTQVVPRSIASETDATPTPTPTPQTTHDDWGSYYLAHQHEPVTVSGPAGSCRSIVQSHLSIVPGGYHVTCVNGPIAEQTQGQSERTVSYGVTNTDDRTIKISIPTAKGHYLATLWHEVGHAIQSDYFTHSDENTLLSAIGQHDEKGPYQVNALEQWARGFAVCVGGQRNDSYPAQAPCSTVTQIRSEIDGRTGVDIGSVGTSH